MTEAAVQPLPAVVSRVRRDVLVGGLMLGLSFAFWLVGVTSADLTKLSGYGLLTALPRSYFVGLALLAVGFVYTVSRATVRPALAGSFTLALVVQLHATAAILYDEPRYSWVYKHLGVIDYIGRHGEVHRSIDIYHNWPASFALAAWLGKAAGVDPSAIAPWAQVFFELAAVAAIVFAVRGLTRDPRRVWTAAWLYVVANWVGQDYLSPQAFAFVLSMVVLGLALRLPRPGERSELRTGALLAAGGMCSLAVIVSHQLSPIFLILDLGALWVVRRRPTLPALAVVVAAEIAWVAHGWAFISSHFNLFDVSSSLNKSAGPDAHPLAGVDLGTKAAQLSMTVMGLLALAGFFRAWRNGRVPVIPAVLATVPFPFVLIQRYGGEGPLRAYLFALPWLALLAAELVVPSERKEGARTKSVLLFAATACVAAGSLFGYFGQETLNRMTSADIAASRWFLDHATPDANMVLLASNFPERVDANYVNHLEPAYVLARVPGVAGPRFAERGMAALERIVHAEPARDAYVIVTPGQLEYLRYTGLASPAAASTLASNLERSADFELVYRYGMSEIFRYRR